MGQQLQEVGDADVAVAVEIPRARREKLVRAHVHDRAFAVARNPSSYKNAIGNRRVAVALSPTG